MVRYPPLAVSFTQAHLCETPSCNVLRDSCAIPHKNKNSLEKGLFCVPVQFDDKSLGTVPGKTVSGPAVLVLLRWFLDSRKEENSSNWSGSRHPVRLGLRAHACGRIAFISRVEEQLCPLFGPAAVLSAHTQ